MCLKLKDEMSFTARRIFSNWKKNCLKLEDESSQTEIGQTHGRMILILPDIFRPGKKFPGSYPSLQFVISNNAPIGELDFCFTRQIYV